MRHTYIVPRSSDQPNSSIISDGNVFSLINPEWIITEWMKDGLIFVIIIIILLSMGVHFNSNVRKLFF